MTHYKLIILVIASRNKIYDGFITDMWKPIIEYSKKNHPEVLIKLLFNNIPTDDLKMEDDILKYSYTENFIPGILNKTLDSIEYCNKNFTYDYIFRTNLSSFIIIDRIVKLVDTFEKTNVYKGIKMPWKSSLSYCSGAGFFLSNDLANYIINFKHKLDYSLFDDVSIGYLLTTFIDTKKCSMFSIIMKDDTILNDTYFSNINTYINNNNIYHVRLRNKERKNDVIIAIQLVKMFYT